MQQLAVIQRVFASVGLLGVGIALAVARAGVVAEVVCAGELQQSDDASVDEPLAHQFSLPLATQFLDTAATHWIETRRCAACHTIPPYLIARPLLPESNSEVGAIRAFVERIVTDRLEAEPQLPRDGVVAVMVQVATALAINDRLTTGRLHPVTREALDRMWTRQRDDGTWEWPFRDVPPVKIDEHYGVMLAAIGVGMAPDRYAETESARAGMKRIRQYLARNPPVSLHQQAMVAWASAWNPEFLTPQERTLITEKLLAAQSPDGGWSLARLVNNIPVDANVSGELSELLSKPGYGTEFLAYSGRSGVYVSPLFSDGYATGFVMHVARQTGVPANDPRLLRGLDWLKRNQRLSGRWFTPSQGNHTRNYLSNTGTAYAVMAIQECESPGEAARILPP